MVHPSLALQSFKVERDSIQTRTCNFHFLNNTDIANTTLLGELGPVSDLCATENGPGYLLISWKAPFSLDITESDSDMWFSLSALTPNGSLLTCAACQNITNPFYNLSLSSFHHKGVYEIEVVAGNVYSSGNKPVKMPVYVMEQVSTHKDLSNISTNSTALGMLYHTLVLYDSSIAAAPDQVVFNGTSPPTSCTSARLSGHTHIHH